MKTRVIVSLIIFLGLIFFSCKKKENTVAPTSTSTSNTIYPGGDLFTLTQQYYNGATFGYEDSIAYGYFADINMPGNYANAGQVSFNGTVLQNSLGFYQDTTFILNLHQPNSVWTINGSSQVTAFNHTYTPSYPQFTGNNLLPDSFSLSVGFTINFGSSISNNNDTTLLSITLDGVIKKIAPGQTSCTITPSDLIGVSVNNGGNIRLRFSKVNTVTYNNRNYTIHNNLTHSKYGIKIKA
jgi:hypothetical protein